MRRLLVSTAGLCLLCAVLAVAPAQASFGLTGLDVSFREESGAPATQAGSHPFSMTTELGIPTHTTPEGEVPDGEVKDLTIEQIPGLVGSQTAVPTCSAADFNRRVEGRPSCADASAVGYSGVEVEFEVIPPSEAGLLFHVPVYNLEPPPGVAAQLGFVVLNIPVTVDVRVSEEEPYNLVAELRNIPQAILFYRSELTIWGDPASPVHDPLRGACLGSGPEVIPTAAPVSLGTCPASVARRPFLTLPRSCEGPLRTDFSAVSWLGEAATGSAELGGEAGAPAAMTDCGRLDFNPRIAAQPTSSAAESSTGLDFRLEVDDEGLTNPTGIAQSDVRRAVVTLPQGMTVNPSAAEGLGVCTLAQYRAASLGGGSCPDSARIGTIRILTPLLGEALEGDLFLAAPYDNPFGSLLAVYLLIGSERNGIFVKQAGRVEPDPATGRLLSTFEGIPQLPFSSLAVHFRDGARAPLVTPPACGTHTTTAELTPWSGGAPVLASSSFTISSGPMGSACPPGGTPPFDPGFEAGTLNNAAGAYSPFAMRLTRRDGEQDMTRFDATLPPGVLGKIAGIERCPEAGISRAIARTGPHGAAEELADPSCPAGSKIGRTTAGAGVGAALTYVPGSIYLAGPYNGAPLSVVAITPAKAGPFDVGTVVVREALALNPVTAQVEVDGAASDPIPHILRGIPLKLRDLRVEVDRPEFTINATSCAPDLVQGVVHGSFADLLNSADDVPVSVSARYQAAGCASLPFAPRLAIELKGGTRRGAHPALKAVVTPRPGDANFSNAVVTLPRSAFLDQAHIRTICTRVQFAAGEGHGANCPKGSVYGKAKAWSPLLDGPAEGPVYLRSSSNNLPDLVVALQGPPSAPFQVELSSRIDSVRGGIRSSFESIPDVPVSKFVLEMQGGKKGLIVNSRNLCFKPKRNRVDAKLTGQNGRLRHARPALIARGCGKGRER